MPTTFDFGRGIANTPGSTVTVSGPNDITVTAAIDDGTISIGDEVVVSGPGVDDTAVSRQSGISDGDTAFYLGALDMGDGTTAYVFSLSPTVADTTPDGNSFLILTETDDFPSSDGQTALSNFLLNAVRADRPTPVLENEPACFLAGAMISTPEGARPVEALRIGDALLTAAGASIPVAWIGRQSVRTRFAGLRMQPECIRAGALGDGLPHTDLTVTADHGMVLDGYVINASALVNGHSIDFVPMAELGGSFTVYHIETEDHDVILANGAPAETFIDVAGRRAFDNYQEYLDLYGVERIIAPLPQPRISSARLLPDGIRSRLGSSMAQPASTMGAIGEAPR